MTNFEKIQNYLSELATLLLIADGGNGDKEYESFWFNYTIHDYANLCICLSSILSVEYTRNLSEITAELQIEPHKYADSPDIQERVSSINAPFVYHLWLTAREIVDKSLSNNQKNNA